MRSSRASWYALSLAAALAMSVPVTTGDRRGQISSAVTGIIAGRVVDAVTGTPVPGATVTLDWVSAEAAASSAPVVRTPLAPGAVRPGVQVTDETGRFEYAGLTAGRFRLQVRGGPGYRWGYFGMQTSWDVAAQNVQHELRSSERLTGIALKLWPSGSISGTVRDEFGEPLVKASLRLFERQPGALTSDWTRTTVSAETDDRGQYRLGDRALRGYVGDGPGTLPGPGPGEYLIVVTAPPGGPAGTAAFPGAVFSGGTRSAVDAQVISLGEGEHRTGIDIVVPTKPGADWVSLRGRVVNSDVLQSPSPVSGGKPSAPLQLRLVPSATSGELANFLEITTAGTATAGSGFRLYRPATTDSGDGSSPMVSEAEALP